jgi:hypothetical protein
MINLKLAEYNKDGKFQGFLELGKDFLFADYFIFIPKSFSWKPFRRFIIG